MKMNREKAKTVHDTLLRGGFCAIWIIASIITVEGWMESQTVTVDLENALFIRVVVCGVAGLVAMGIHVYLLMKDKREKGGDDLWM